MGNILHMWFIQELSEHIPIFWESKSHQVLPEIIRKDDFCVSIGWSDKLKKRFGIRLLTVSAENLRSDEYEVQSFMERLFWRMFPHKTFGSSKEESAADIK